MDDETKLDNYDYTVYLLKEFIKNEKEEAYVSGGLFKGRMIAYEEILEILTRR